MSQFNGLHTNTTHFSKIQAPLKGKGVINQQCYIFIVSAVAVIWHISYHIIWINKSWKTQEFNHSNPISWHCWQFWITFTSNVKQHNKQNNYCIAASIYNRLDFLWCLLFKSTAESCRYCACSTTLQTSVGKTAINILLQADDSIRSNSPK